MNKKGGWQNVLKTNQQNVREFFFAYSFVESSQNWIISITLPESEHDWWWTWSLEFKTFHSEKKLMHSWMIHWIVCLALKRPMCILRRSAHRWKSSMTLKSLLWLAVDESFMYTSSNQVFFSDFFGSSTILTDASRRVSEPSVSSSGSYHCY